MCILCLQTILSWPVTIYMVFFYWIYVSLMGSICFLVISFNIQGHITAIPACSMGALTMVLPHWNAALQTQNTTPPPRHVQTQGMIP